jgi:hypothetical protein
MLFECEERKVWKEKGRNGLETGLQPVTAMELPVEIGCTSRALARLELSV